jgi:hypothetical protein
MLWREIHMQNLCRECGRRGIVSSSAENTKRVIRWSAITTEEFHS